MQARGTEKDKERERGERENVKSAEASGLMTCRPVHAQLATATFSNTCHSKTFLVNMPDTRADFALLPLFSSKIHRALIEDLF